MLWGDPGGRAQLSDGAALIHKLILRHEFEVSDRGLESDISSQKAS